MVEATSLAIPTSPLVDDTDVDVEEDIGSVVDKMSAGAAALII